MSNDINYYEDIDKIEYIISKTKDKERRLYWILELHKLIIEIREIYPEMVDGYTEKYFRILRKQAKTLDK